MEIANIDAHYNVKTSKTRIQWSFKFMVVKVYVPVNFFFSKRYLSETKCDSQIIVLQHPLDEFVNSPILNTGILQF